MRKSAPLTEASRAQVNTAESDDGCGGEHRADARPDNDRYRRLFASELTGVAFCDAQGRWTEPNQALCELLDCEPAAMLDKPWSDFTDPGDREKERTLLGRIRRGEIDAYAISRKLLGRAGQAVDVLFSVEAVRNPDGAIDYFIVVVTRQPDMARLSLLADGADHAMHGIVVTDANAKILEVNQAFTRITGYTPDEALGQATSILKSGQHDQAFYADMWKALKDNGYWSGEIWNRHKDGEKYIEHLSISAIRDQHGETQNFVASFSDVTQQKILQRQLEHNAYFDALTNLPNRNLLEDRLQQAMANAERRKQRLAVVFLDLDGFKEVNDEHGHGIGDNLLIAVSDRLGMLVREGDTVARFGGDEFVIVALDLGNSQSAAVSFLKRVLNAVRQPVQLDDHLFSLSASLGAVFYPQSDEGVGADQLLRRADQAMYQAKTAGKNRYHVFDSENDQARARRPEDIERIRKGLQRGEFAVHYQPKVNMRTGEVLGAEALVRWNHEDRGQLLPGSFLPYIEDHPLIGELGEWVTECVLNQLGEWRRRGLDYSASVNVCAYRLQQGDFVMRLKQMLDAHPTIEPGQLELEVLESSALRDVSHVAQIMSECQSIGVNFALDDFGTGYSSLAYLKHLPAEQLKIDKSFVQGMLEDPDDLAILEGIIGLAGAFRRDVVAEGVETLEHGSWLLKLGCDVAQGFAIGRPMTAQQFDDWALHWSPDPRWVSERRIDREEVPLLFASAEHRAWISAIEAFLRGRQESAPELDRLTCRFGKWLQSDEADHFRARQPFREIEEIHGRIHAIASGLITRHDDADDAATPGVMEDLFQLRDALLGRVMQMLC